MPFEDLDSEELQNIFNKGLGASRADTLNFWLHRLEQICKSDLSLYNQACYVAEVLTEFSGKPIDLARQNWAVPKFIFLPELKNSDQLKKLGIAADKLEDIGRHFLFLSGFEEKYVASRFGLEYTFLFGSYVFRVAGAETNKSILFQIADNFKNWQRRLAFLHYELIENRRDLTGNVKEIIVIPHL